MPRSGADELGEGVWNGAIEEIHFLIVPFHHKRAGQQEIFQTVSGKVLELDVPPRPAAASGGAVEAEHAPCPSVITDCVNHGAVLGKDDFCTCP